MDRETKRFLQGMNRRRREWKAWCDRQAGKISGLFETARKHAANGRYREARRTAWKAIQGMDDLDRVWARTSAEGNEVIKTMPKGWKSWARKRKAERAEDARTRIRGLRGILEEAIEKVPSRPDGFPGRSPGPRKVE